MTTNNKQLAVDHFNRINVGDIAGAAALVAEDCVLHAALPSAQGRKGLQTILTKSRTAMPDLQYRLDDTIVDGDRVVVRLTVTGTNTGPLTFTHMESAPTGKAVQFEQIHIMRFSNGKVVEAWMAQDQLALFRQLGVQLKLPS